MSRSYFVISESSLMQYEGCAIISTVDAAFKLNHSATCRREQILGTNL